MDAPLDPGRDDLHLDGLTLLLASNGPQVALERLPFP